LRRLGRNAEAVKRLDSAFARLGRLKLYPAEEIQPGAETDATLCALADLEAERGRVSHSIEIYEELLRKVLATRPKPDTNLADAVDMSRLYGALAGLRRRAGQNDFATAAETQRLELWRRWDIRLTRNAFVKRQLSAIIPEARRP